jgi:hypothetical protein
MLRLFLIMGMAGILVACAATPAPTSTVPPSSQPPTQTPQALVQLAPTQTPRPVRTVTDVPTSTPTASPTRTPTPFLSPTPTRRVSATPTPTITPTSVPETRVGQSAGGRAIIARTFGEGQRVILLVGGIHGGWESNTVDLMTELGVHFRENPEDILPGFSVVIIPTMNPDGVAVGNDLAGRFNGNGVDLNRNWACGWQPEAVWREGPVDPGARPFSEPESQAVAAFIGSIRPEAVLFYHSAADGVFAGDCPRRAGAWRSGELSAIYGEASGYSYGEAFSAYPVTGTAPSWVDGLDIPAADVELSSARDSQFEQNLRGILAIQCWLAGGCE